MNGGLFYLTFRVCDILSHTQVKYFNLVIPVGIVV